MERIFFLGSPWLFYKIYTGANSSDIILEEIVKKAMNLLVSKGLVSKWFFIRYGDPKYHIRLRIYCRNKNNIGEIINILYPELKKLFEENFIWKLEIGTYKRELERYGEHSILLAEDIFYFDSKMIVNFLSFQNMYDPTYRWLFALKSLDSFMNIFKLSTIEKYNLIESLRVSFNNEFKVNKILRKQINKKYKYYENQIENFFIFQDENIKLLLLERDENLANSLELFKKLNDKSKIKLKLESFISSCMHMSMNRIFKSKNRLNEMVCYDFLSKYYKTKLMKIRKN